MTVTPNAKTAPIPDDGGRAEQNSMNTLAQAPMNELQADILWAKAVARKCRTLLILSMDNDEPSLEVCRLMMESLGFQRSLEREVERRAGQR